MNLSEWEQYQIRSTRERQRRLTYTSRNRRIQRLCHEGVNQTWIAVQFGITQGRVSQIVTALDAQDAALAEYYNEMIKDAYQ